MKSEARGLERYNQMRDFGTTEEPSGEHRPTKGGNSFVIQQHAATAMHFDFRLELDGVLLSWAVPKGPSLSTKERRLAVQTEDHPVDYRNFEGTIPKGEYGGGSVIVWDRGTWEPLGDPRAGLEKGKLEFIVHGEKLEGKYRLVRLAPKDRDRGKKNWLLMKGSDEHVRDGAEAEVVKQRPRSVLSDRTVDDVRQGVPALAHPTTKKQKKQTGAPRTGAAARRAADAKPAADAAPHSAAKAAPKRSRAKEVAATASSKTATTASPPPTEVKVQLATLVDDVPVGNDWVYELKYDGYRAVATLDDGSVKIATRNGKDWTKTFSLIAEAVAHVRAKTAIFDGEIAYVMEDGKTDFQKLQNALSGSADVGQLVYFVFDLLYYDGVDLRDEPLEARKEKLRTILAGEKPPLAMGDHARGSGVELFEHACAMGLEGIIAKRADRPYRGGRGADWVKVKCQKRQELIIVGYTLPRGRRSGIGALLLGVHEGKDIRYAGKVGTGFSQASLDDLAARLGPLVIDEPAVTKVPRLKDAHWTEPKLVCEVRFTEWTQDGALRHPSFQGLREDKKPSAVIREESKPLPATKKRDEARLGKVKLTHPERVVDPSSGVTKRELADYAEASVEYFLPFATKRPLMMLRCTDAFPAEGQALQGRKPNRGSCFVQKHAGRGLVSNIGRGEVDGEEIVYVTSAEQVFGLVQLNAVELHGWGSRLPKIEKPDWVVFDLDPDVGLPFERVVEAAVELRDEMAKLGLTSFVKTTGGKGLHVVIPLAQKEEWPLVSAFAAGIAQALAKRAPKQYVATMTKAARKGKIFIDHFRNGRGATAILPYSPRARPGATVALPVSWEELPRVEPKELDVRSVPTILAKRRVDPWADLLTTNQTLPRAVLDLLRG